MNTKIKKIMLGAPALGAMGIGAVSTVASCSRNPGVESITKITFAPKFVEQFDDNIQQINQRCLAGYQYNSIAPVVYDQQGKDVTDKCSLAIRDQDRSFLNNVGLTFSDGVISGTPSIAVTTTHKIELFAYYEKLEPASITFDFTISANTIRFNDEYPNITCYTSKTMTPTKQITVYDVRHTDVQSQCTYALLDASGETATLPTGLNFNSSTGVVSGTPPSESSSMTNLRIQATYNGQTTFSESFNLDVKLNTFRFASNYGDDNGCINYESGDNFSHKYKPVI
jgi:hypothetical protein